MMGNFGAPAFTGPGILILLNTGMPQPSLELEVTLYLRKRGDSSSLPGLARTGAVKLPAIERMFYVYRRRITIRLVVSQSLSTGRLSAQLRLFLFWPSTIPSKNQPKALLELNPPETGPPKGQFCFPPKMTVPWIFHFLGRTPL